jgi:hypothetical protein
MNPRTILAAVVSLLIAHYANAQDLIYQIKNSLTPEEQALWDKNLTMEKFSPNEHSSISIARIDAT